MQAWEGSTEFRHDEPYRHDLSSCIGISYFVPRIQCLVSLSYNTSSVRSTDNRNYYYCFTRWGMKLTKQDPERLFSRQKSYPDPVSVLC